MEPKDLSTICQELLRWQRSRKNTKTLQHLFTDYIGFQRTVPQTGFPPPESTYLHLYPAIAEPGNSSKEKLHLNFYLVPDIYDNERSLHNGELERSMLKISLSEDGIEYDPSDDEGNGPISTEEGLERIVLWITIRDTWLQAASENGIYSALMIPSKDIREIDTNEAGDKTIAAYFALKMTSISSSFVLFWADLVLNRSPKSIGILHDTVRPVPPFGSGFEEERFFLLKHAQQDAAR